MQPLSHGGVNLNIKLVFTLSMFSFTNHSLSCQHYYVVSKVTRCCPTPSPASSHPNPSLRTHTPSPRQVRYSMAKYPPSGWVKFSHYLLKKVQSVFCKKIVDVCVVCAEKVLDVRNSKGYVPIVVRLEGVERV